MSGITPEVRLKNEIRRFQPDLEARNQSELAEANVNHSLGVRYSVYFTKIGVCSEVPEVLLSVEYLLALQLRFRGNSDSLGFHDSAWGSWDDGSFHRDNA